MFYYCPLCKEPKDEPVGWIEDKSLPTHLNKQHGHRLRTIEQIENEWSMIGILEKCDERPKKQQ